ncbi:MAG: type I-F CRISPR-associated protein Csy1 [Dissulfuribacterales bacterium]
MNQGIQEFLDERKELWLGSRVKKRMSDDEVAGLKEQATGKYSLAKWLPDAVKRAKQLSMVSHPGKFTHPSAKVSSVIAAAKCKPDGFLRSGNVEVGLDVFGNAAALDVHKFLMIVMDDGKTVLEHLEQDSDTIREYFTIPTIPYSEIAEGLLAVKSDNQTGKTTSGRVKQVYFPVADDYHLLSILTPSNLIFEMKKRINNMRFSDEAKEVRNARKKGEIHSNGFSDIYDLTVIGYGGTKPQNISVLNSQNGGKAYLLSSLPPTLKQRRVNPPKDNFFAKKYLGVKGFEADFQRFHKNLKSGQKNFHARNRLHRTIRDILHQVIDESWQVRFLAAGWSDSDYYKRLPLYQKLWLDQQFEDKRRDETEWLDAVKEGMARWFVNMYLKLWGEDAQPLGDKQIKQIRNMIDEYEGALQ